jgi:hypothetical protein
VTLKLTFKDGGFSEFDSKLGEIKARLHHAAQIAEESGQRNWALTVHDEQLPEYTASQGQGSSDLTRPTTGEVAQRADVAALQADMNQAAPDEPPPDYDEAQAQAVSMRLDERLREEAERQ